MSTQRRICLRCERMSRSGGKATPRQIVVADGNASLPMDRKFAPRFQPVLPVFQADLHAAMATTSFLQGHQRISISTTDFCPRDTHVPYKGRSLFVKSFEADNDLFFEYVPDPASRVRNGGGEKKRDQREHIRTWSSRLHRVRRLHEGLHVRRFMRLRRLHSAWTCSSLGSRPSREAMRFWRTALMMRRRYCVMPKVSILCSPVMPRRRP